MKRKFDDRLINITLTTLRINYRLYNYRRRRRPSIGNLMKRQNETTITLFIYSQIIVNTQVQCIV